MAKSHSNYTDVSDNRFVPGAAQKLNLRVVDNFRYREMCSNWERFRIWRSDLTGEVYHAVRRNAKGIEFFHPKRNNKLNLRIVPTLTYAFIYNGGFTQFTWNGAPAYQILFTKMRSQFYISPNQLLSLGDPSMHTGEMLRADCWGGMLSVTGAVTGSTRSSAWLDDFEINEELDHQICMETKSGLILCSLCHTGSYWAGQLTRSPLDKVAQDISVPVTTGLLVKRGPEVHPKSQYSALNVLKARDTPRHSDALRRRIPVMKATHSVPRAVWRECWTSPREKRRAPEHVASLWDMDSASHLATRLVWVPSDTDSPFKLSMLGVKVSRFDAGDLGCRIEISDIDSIPLEVDLARVLPGAESEAQRYSGAFVNLHRALSEAILADRATVYLDQGNWYVEYNGASRAVPNLEHPALI